MAYKTKLQVETKIKKDMDLEEEEFVQASELTEYLNDGIEIIEAHINTMGLQDDYFLTKTTLDLVSGTADYALPSNLYAHKIKEVVYSNGATIYRITPIRKSATREQIEHLNRFSTTEYYQYRVRSDSSSESYFELIPASRETVTGAVKIEYYRDLARVSADADLVEVPGVSLQWLYQYVKTMIYEKEGHALLDFSVNKLQALEKLMLETLRGQLADSSLSLMEVDKSIYEDMS